MNITNSTLRKPPLGIWLISAFYLFGAIILFISLFTNPIHVSRSIADAHGLPPQADTVILPLVICLALLIAFGLVQGNRWGFYLTSAYLFIFGAVSLWLSIQAPQQPYIGNATWSIMALIYLAWQRKYFLRRKSR
jgi:hypothetical protein